MSVVKTLQERIEELEKQRKELVQWRKNEIFEVINANGGICLDNRLLAGLAIYASMEENRNDAFLEKLKQINQVEYSLRALTCCNAHAQSELSW